MLYYTIHPYYPNRDKGIDVFLVSIITIVTGIYDSRWRVFSRPRLPAKARKYSGFRVSYESKWSLSIQFALFLLCVCHSIEY